MTSLRRIRGAGRWLAALTVSIVLSACGGSGSDSSSDSDNPAPSGDQTELYISLTDAEGDFLVYQVDVTNITLTRANGAVVNVLPRTTSVDFAQYVEVSELLTIADVPAGRYDGASMTLDYSSAEITVQDENGEALNASVIDGDGNPLSSVTMDVQFNDDDGFVLAPGIPAQVTLDFDLDASHQITIENGNATVVVEPLLIADTLLEEPKTFRVRGLLQDVSPEQDEFSLLLRPFRVRVYEYGGSEVNVSEDTLYEIDGQSYVGAAGLEALAAKEAGTATVTEGYWDRSMREYVAETVLAGSSVPWDQADIVRGTVVGRVGDTLSIRGAIIELAEGQVTFNDTFTVQISAETSVVRSRDGEVGSEAISVGSAIYATGEVVDGASLDASAGLVRVLPSSVSGIAVSASPLALDVNRLNARQASIYDFSGTGSSPETDADPEFYEVFTSTIDISGVEIGDPVRVRGYIRDFGTAPEDITATTVIDVASVRAHLVVNYGADGAAGAITVVGDQFLQIDLSEADVRHHMVFAGIPVDLKTLDETPVIAPGAVRGVYAICVNRRIEIYTYYDRYAAALEDYLNDGAEVLRLDAHGYYDGDEASFSSQRIKVILSTN